MATTSEEAAQSAESTEIEDAVASTSLLKDSATSKDAVLIPHQPGAPQLPTKWSDEAVLEMNQKLFFPESLKTSVVQKEVVVRFFNFYFNGTIDEGFTVADIISCAIAVIPAEGDDSLETMWAISDFSSDGIQVGKARLKTGENEIFSELNLNKLVGSPVYMVGASQIIAGRRMDASAILKYTPEHSEAFHAEISKMLSRWNSPEANQMSQIELRRLAGFLALVLARSCVAKAKQITRAFLKQKFIADLSHIAWSTRFSPPCDLCIHLMVKNFRKGTPSMGNLSIKILSRYIQLQNSDNNYFTTKMLRALLNQTRYYGMDLIPLINTACKFLSNVNWPTLGQWTDCEETRASWISVIKFVETYWCRENQQYTYPWARILSDTYFKELSCENNLYLCGILGVVSAEANRSEGIWYSMWARRNKSYLSVPKQIGRDLIKAKTGFRIETCCQTEAARRVWGYMAEDLRKSGIPNYHVCQFSHEGPDL